MNLYFQVFAQISAKKKKKKNDPINLLFFYQYRSIACLVKVRGRFLFALHKKFLISFLSIKVFTVNSIFDAKSPSILLVIPVSMH